MSLKGVLHRSAFDAVAMEIVWVDAGHTKTENQLPAYDQRSHLGVHTKDSCTHFDSMCINIYIYIYIDR